MSLGGTGGNGTVDTTGGDIGLSGILSGPGGLTNAGPGTLTLSGLNTYSGPTIVNGGVLYAGAADSLSPNSDFTVNGGTLDATGSAQGGSGGGRGGGGFGGAAAAPQTVNPLQGGKRGGNRTAQTVMKPLQGGRGGRGGFGGGGGGVFGGGAGGGSPGQTVNSLTMGPGGTLNLQAGNLLTSADAAFFAGTLNIAAATGTGELVAYRSYGGGTFGTVAGLPSGDCLSYTATQLDIVAAPTLGVARQRNLEQCEQLDGRRAQRDGAGAAIDAPTLLPLTVTLDAPQAIGMLLLGNSLSTTIGLHAKRPRHEYAHAGQLRHCATYRGSRRQSRHRCPRGFGRQPHGSAGAGRWGSAAPAASRTTVSAKD